eukprot:7082613-Ditylum_brightwellii.AAC.1
MMKAVKKQTHQNESFLISSVLSLNAILMIEEGTLHCPRFLIKDEHDEYGNDKDSLDNHHNKDGDHHNKIGDHSDE